MQQKVKWRDALKVGGWFFLFTLIGILVNIVWTIGLNNWDWGLFTPIFQRLWPLFLIILGVVCIYLIIYTKYTIQTLSTGIGLMALIFLIAAYKDQPTSVTIKNYIDSHFDVNYLAASITLIAFLLSIVALNRTRKKDEEKQIDPVTPIDPQPKHAKSTAPIKIKKPVEKKTINPKNPAKPQKSTKPKKP